MITSLIIINGDALMITDVVSAQIPITRIAVAVCPREDKYHGTSTVTVPRIKSAITNDLRVRLLINGVSAK